MARSFGAVSVPALLAGLFITSTAGALGTAKQTNLTSDGSVTAAFTDTNLVNPWGVAFASTGPWWVSDNHTGVTTVYDGTGAKYPSGSPLVVTIPAPAGVTGPSSPTGQIYNATSGFAVTKAGKTGAPLFVFVTEDGTISGWAPSVDFGHAVIAVDKSASGAVYKGIAQVSSTAGTALMVTNFHSGMVEIYDSKYKLTGQFRDTGTATVPAIPANYSPYNVAALNGHIYVTYAKADKLKHDNVGGAGFGYVDEVTAAGALVRRIASNGKLNGPWGLAIAPATFGHLAGSLLVGNFSSGKISAYRLRDGLFLSELHAATGGSVRIDGLWALSPGNGGLAGDPNKIYFTAGPVGETHGVFGNLTFTP